jgi:hypothetical protein
MVASSDALDTSRSIRMANSSIETLEPRWAPARLVAGPLPSGFGVDLTVYDPELLQGSITFEVLKSDSQPYSYLLVQLTTGWSPDPQTIAFARSEIAHDFSLPAGFPEYLSADRKEALVASLEAQSESGETTGETTGGGFTSPARRGR